MTPMTPARAIAHSNIALCKYWGKRGDPALNLPAVGSLSLTLEGLWTETEVGPGDRDAFELAGTGEGEARKVFAHLDRIWAASGRTGARPPCRVRSVNHLPTAAGLASSASGFAALTLAAATAFEWSPPRTTLSALARMCSGSAAFK